jgi:hypothetical protein
LVVELERRGIPAGSFTAGFRVTKEKPRRLSMKALICSVVVMLGLLSTVQAHVASVYAGYPA